MKTRECFVSKYGISCLYVDGNNNLNIFNKYITSYIVVELVQILVKDILNKANDIKNISDYDYLL